MYLEQKQNYPLQPFQFYWNCLAFLTEHLPYGTPLQAAIFITDDVMRESTQGTLNYSGYRSIKFALSLMSYWTIGQGNLTGGEFQIIKYPQRGGVGVLFWLCKEAQ